MLEYRVYPISEDNHVSGAPKIIVCATDQDAISEARRLLDGKDIEVWHGTRMVIRLSSPVE
jgi:hypothetical protein